MPNGQRRAHTRVVNGRRVQVGATRIASPKRVLIGCAVGAVLLATLPGPSLLAVVAAHPGITLAIVGVGAGLWFGRKGIAKKWRAHGQRAMARDRARIAAARKQREAYRAQYVSQQQGAVENRGAWKAPTQTSTTPAPVAHPVNKRQEPLPVEPAGDAAGRHAVRVKNVRLTGGGDKLCADHGFNWDGSCGTCRRTHSERSAAITAPSRPPKRPAAKRLQAKSGRQSASVRAAKFAGMLCSQHGVKPVTSCKGCQKAAARQDRW